MKKIFITVGLFLFFPINAFASDCTQEMIESYLPQANQVSLTYQATTNPDTYMIYVNGLTSGISFNGINGATFDNGFYAYAQAGETFTISIRISDGSVCALQEIKKTSVKLPSNAQEIEPESEPVESNEEKPEEEPSETTNDSPKTEASPSPKPKPPVTTNPDIIDNSENEEAKEELEYIEEEEELISEDQVEDIALEEDSEKQKIAESISDIKKIPYLILIPIISIIGSIIFIIYKRRKLD